MHRLALALVAATLAAVLASCYDAPDPGGVAPVGAPSARLDYAGVGRIAVCHATGRADAPEFVEITVAEPAADEHLDARGTPRAGHERDYLVTDRTPCPPPAASSALRVCKVGAVGIADGAPFTFLLGGETVTLPAGGCVLRSYRVGTRVDVSETVPTDATLTAITLAPSGAGTTDLAAGTASVVVGTDTAALTFTNASTTSGDVVICKVAGAGIASGTTASFTVAGIADPVVVAAGAGPTGTCSAPLAVTAGSVRVTETLAPNTAVSGTPTVSPVDANLGGASSATTFSVDLRVTAGQTTTVTFTNASTLGAVVICKVAGTGITPGTSASFTVTGASAPISVAAGAGPAGTCSAPIAVPSGSVSVTETLAPNTAVSGTPIVEPLGYNLGGSSTPTTFTMDVRVDPGQTTTVTFTNVSTLGSVVVCKVAGTGITPGTTASFTVTDGAGTALASPLTLAAGVGPTGTCTAPMVAPAGEVRVTETLAPNTAVGGTPVVSPAGAALGGSTTSTTFTYRVLVTAGQTTTVTFTNVASP